jgi:tetratricopeptide (TPR) repeat protein
MNFPRRKDYSKLEAVANSQATRHPAVVVYRIGSIKVARISLDVNQADQMLDKRRTFTSNTVCLPSTVFKICIYSARFRCYRNIAKIMNVSLWFLWLILLTFVHESGHALVGRALGFKVFWVSIGYGRQIFEWHIFGVSLRVNLIPLGGMTVSAPRTQSGIRLRLWLATFAGPATHLILLATCYLVLGPGFFRDRIFSTDLFSRLALVETFIFANAFLLLVNLFSKGSGNTAGFMYSDGYQLLKIPFLKEEEIEELRNALVGLEALDHMRAGNTERAITLYEDALKANPTSYILRHDLAIARLTQGDYEHARNEFIDLLNWRESSQIEKRILIFNNIAWTDAVLGKDEFLAEADQYSEQAIKFAPKVAGFMGTRGAVLVRTGRPDDGIRMLRTAFWQHSDRTARASVACWIAIGEAMRGSLIESSSWLEKARKESPSYYLREMAEKEVQSQLARGGLSLETRRPTVEPAVSDYVQL